MPTGRLCSLRSIAGRAGR
uniref:Uncharacterized protein n=1 Tax=Anguilla anguilla TaxID=7936 RepID=A0A0E9QZW5_ANGAN